MVIISALPSRILQSNFESYCKDKIGRSVPILFIPDKVQDTKHEENQSAVNIVILTMVTSSLHFSSMEMQRPQLS